MVFWGKVPTRQSEIPWRIALASLKDYDRFYWLCASPSGPLNLTVALLRKLCLAEGANKSRHLMGLTFYCIHRIYLMHTLYLYRIYIYIHTEGFDLCFHRLWRNDVVSFAGEIGEQRNREGHQPCSERYHRASLRDGCATWMKKGWKMGKNIQVKSLFKLNLWV